VQGAETGMGRQRSENLASETLMEEILSRENKSVFKELESWIKRRLRCMIWKQWDGAKKRYQELRRGGVRTVTAWATTKSGHGSWRLSKSPAVQTVLNRSYFKSLGLLSLSEMFKSPSSRRTAV
jgi:hypothetical protein